jgi:hypothetical protein
MKNRVAIVSSLLACVVVLAARVGAKGREQEPDRLCQMLFEEYVVGRGKINAPTITAATHIVAERGRYGFWRDVFRELQKDDPETEIGCVRVLGKMLEMDANAEDASREAERTGTVLQSPASRRLDSEVVAYLIQRGEKADRFRVDQFATALARARVPEAGELFRSILRDDTGKHYMPSAKFHAAVGLAQCGEASGFQWLIENCDDPTPTISNAWPDRVPSLNLDVCCIAALRELSGQSALRTRQDCEAWWKQEGEKPLARGRVRLVEY